MPSNFRTYEAQSRLLAAVIAAHPGLKLNFKAITLHFGSDVTESVIRHRIRPVKMQAEAIRQAVSQGQDAKDFSSIFYLNEKEINKYFGESTPQGIEFQFRAIKKDAKALRDAVDKGESPLTARKNVPAASRRTPASTPSKRKAASLAAGLESGGGRTAKKVAAAVAGRRQPRAAELIFSNEEDSSSYGEDVDYDQLDLTPVATPTPKQRLPPAALNLVTPTSASFVPDATPALSTGTTPSENETPDTQHQQQPPMSQTAQTFYANLEGRTVFTVDDDDDDDDDGVFLLDTPSKAPKVEAVPTSAVASVPAVAHNVGTSFTAANDYGWTGFDRHDSLTGSSHSFEATGNPSWAQDPFASNMGDSFAHSLANSFYDNDGAI